MNSEQLRQISNIADRLHIHAGNAWSESLSGGNKEDSEINFILFERYLDKLNRIVERFHMDNENEITSERVQP